MPKHAVLGMTGHGSAGDQAAERRYLGDVNDQFSSRLVEFGTGHRFRRFRKHVDVVNDGFQLPLGHEAAKRRQVLRVGLRHETPNALTKQPATKSWPG